MSVLRQPLLHFLLLGGLLFGAERVLPRDEPERAAARAPIVVDAPQIRAEFTQRTGLVATAADEAALVEQAIEEELLYREALARGLDRNDRSIRHRLVQKMAFLSPEPPRTDEEYHREALALGLDRDDVVVRRMLIEKMRLLVGAGVAAPSDDEVDHWIAANMEVFARPARVRLWHLFLGAAPGDGALRMLAELREAQVPPAAAARRGRPFPLGARIGPSSEAQLARTFGTAFARVAMGLPVGTWSGPVASSFGAHLVWIEGREPAAPPPAASVRSSAVEWMRAAERPERLARALAELRRHYQVRVERGEGRTS